MRGSAAALLPPQPPVLPPQRQTGRAAAAQNLTHGGGGGGRSHLPASRLLLPGGWGLRAPPEAATPGSCKVLQGWDPYSARPGCRRYLHLPGPTVSSSPPHPAASLSRSPQPRERLAAPGTSLSASINALPIALHPSAWALLPQGTPAPGSYPSGLLTLSSSGSVPS